MKSVDFDAVQIGDLLPGLSEGPITRHTIGRYAGASGDYNPLHIDIDYVRRAGMPDVFAHGMLSMGWLARALTDVVDQAAIRSLSVRFVAITQVGEEVHCQLRVTDKFVCNDEKRVALEVSASNQLGALRLIGSAVVALS